MTRNQRLALLTTTEADKERRRRRLHQKRVRRTFPSRGLRRPN